MTDDQIQHLIITEINRRDITFYDMIGEDRIDPEPGAKNTMRHQRARANRFSTTSSFNRMTELLSTTQHTVYQTLPPLKVSLYDLFRFWWNRCVDQELIVEEILEDVFYHFSEQIRPVKSEEDQFDLNINFQELLFRSDSQLVA